MLQNLKTSWERVKAKAVKGKAKRRSEKHSSKKARNKMTKETKKWWEETANDYQEACKIPIGIHYGPGSPFEKELKLLGDLKNKKILEIGCGGAQCGIAMAKKGAKVTGIDISKEQLKFAEKLAEKNKVKIDLYQGDVKKLKQIKSNRQDLVFSAWALQYVDDLESCFKEAYRVLKKGGNFVLALPHPFYSLVDPEKLNLKESYFRPSKWEEVFSDENKKFVLYYRKISDIINTFIKSNFKIEKVLEPDSRKHHKDDPWYNIWEFTPKLMKYLPPTIIFKVKK